MRIWDRWATEDGDLGPVYGEQWTAWPTKDGGKISQIDYMVETLKITPTAAASVPRLERRVPAGRRTKPAAERPGRRQALPPCHLLYRAFVHDGHLSMQLYIRSSDVFLGLPYSTRCPEKRCSLTYAGSSAT